MTSDRTIRMVLWLWIIVAALNLSYVLARHVWTVHHYPKVLEYDIDLLQCDQNHYDTNWIAECQPKI